MLDKENYARVVLYILNTDKFSTEVNMHIRPVAQGVVKRGDSILVAEFHDEKTGCFYRSLGGGIEYGERSEEALMREFKEELNTEVRIVRSLGVLENIFGEAPDLGHEIDFIFEVEFVDVTIYEQEEIVGREGKSAFRVAWKSLSFFEGEAPLYPEGVLELLRKG
jgi:8-oxo-dGTP pyrophosphatase MutT (NUDIX family)